MSIIAKNIACTRSGVCILENVSFELHSSECLILRGPNGVGKTSLIRVLAGLTQPSAGNLDIDWDQVAYAGHNDAIKYQLSVYENLNFWSGVYRGNNLDPVIETFELTSLVERLAGSLSAGQKRRLGLARMALSGRKIWLMDEPTTSLDAKHSLIIADIIKDHCQNGGSAILSTHLDLGILDAKLLQLEQFIPKVSKNEGLFTQGEFA